MIGIIDYGVGNIGSVLRAFESLNIPAQFAVTSDDILAADKLILPGVGHAAKGMANLRERGLVDVIKKRAEDGIPLLGICLGMQLLTKKSEEGETECLGLVDAETVKFIQSDATSPLERRIPHMGWNTVRQEIKHPMFLEIADNAEFYFAHSYYVRPTSEGLILGRTTYQHEFSSVIGTGNIIGAQFHPEKSRDAGMQFLKNFAQKK